ncbi:hypothetical protein [Baaleninema sp.]
MGHHSLGMRLWVVWHFLGWLWMVGVWNLDGIWMEFWGLDLKLGF